MSEWGWAFVTHKSALIKELNHLFWIITLLSKGTAAACLRRNLICLSKNTDRDTPAQRNHGKRVTADRRRQLGMGLIDSHQLSLELCLLLFGVKCWLAGTSLYATVLVKFTSWATTKAGRQHIYDSPTLHISSVVNLIKFHEWNLWRDQK